MRVYRYRLLYFIRKLSADSTIDLKRFVYFLEELRDHFSTYGDIESINVKTDPNTGRSRGFAFIVFAKAEALDKVISAIILLIFFVICQ